ncbi:LPP20 family lipoprotein [Roseovarius sp.]|jgi:hypothetical protein
MKIRFTLALTGAVLAVAGCSEDPATAVAALPAQADAATVALAETKDALDKLSPPAAASVPAAATAASAPAPVQEFQGTGFAQVSRQPGASLNAKRLMAIRAARLEALRDLTEQVHGIRLSSTSSLRDAVLTSNHLQALVEGEIRGARTVRITPKGGDSYEVVMALSPDTVRYILRATGKQGA